MDRNGSSNRQLSSSAVGHNRSTAYRSADSYRNGLQSRLGGGRTNTSASTGSEGRSGTAGTGIQHRGGGGDAARHNVYDPQASTESGSGRGDGNAQGRGQGGREGGRSYGGARNDRNHGHNSHHNRNHVDFYFNLGGRGYGLGCYGGYGYYRSSYWDCDWYSWGYRSWYCAPYYYPRYRSCYFPYFWSYSWYPSYRTVYVYDSREPYVASGYLPTAAFDDDPYAEELEPIASTTNSGTTEAIVPLVSNLDAGSTYDEARANGDRFLKAGESLKAAEAYRQAWIHDPAGDALIRMSWALFSAGDFPLSAWAFQDYVRDERQQAVIAGGLLAELMDGPNIDKAVVELEKYLVANPNDEGSNLLLGSVYVFAGRAYAGYIILGRLEAAGFAKDTTTLMMAEARRALED